MSKLVLVSRERGVLDEQGGFAKSVLPALANLCASGFQLILLADEQSADRLFSDQQFHQVLNSQGISFISTINVDHTVMTAANNGSAPESGGDPKNQQSASSENKAIIDIAGRIAPQLSSGSLKTAESVVIGDWPGLVALANYLSLRHLRPGPFASVETDSAEQLPVRNDGAYQSWPELAQELILPPRVAHVRRRSNETDIEVAVNLDPAVPQLAIASGIGFFDHMLDQLAKHGGFSLDLSCKGDLHIDEHHTVEDCALAIGQVLREALGDKRGIERYGFVLPMDECEVRVSLDLSARPSFHFNGAFSRDKVGELSTEMVPHFFKSLSDTLGASLHITLEGDNAHHQVEASFKGVARTLRQAFKRSGSDLPTTKGLL